MRIRRLSGALAQLVERFHGMEEVSGSTPLSSTEPSGLSPHPSPTNPQTQASSNLIY